MGDLSGHSENKLSLRVLNDYALYSSLQVQGKESILSCIDVYFEYTDDHPINIIEDLDNE